MRDLSILIAVRNEQFLAKTIEDVLQHAKADTEVIAVLDGAWSNPPVAQHPRVTLLYLPEAVGQRAAVNIAAKMSRAAHIMKVDAHCSFSDGFDLELMSTCDATTTVVPRMYNLHAFDWVCQSCQQHTYQGPPPMVCAACQGTSFTQALVWQPRWSRRTDFMRFDSTMHFQYWGTYGSRPEAAPDVADQLCAIGACWMMRRARFWDLGGLDEAHGGWGQMGVEIACKSWLSGGRQVVNKRAWFAHMFRTQPGFRFPYPLHDQDVQRAREHSRKLWIGSEWPGAVRPLAWLLEHFAPVPDWTPEIIASLPTTATKQESVVVMLSESAAPPAPTVGLVYYSDCLADQAILTAAQRQLRACANGHQIISVTLAPIEFGHNIVLPLERSYLTMFRQILAGLEALDTDLAFLVEHDVIYHASHFAFRPPSRDKYFYNLHVWKVDALTGRAVHYETKQTSGLCADRLLLVQHYRERIRRVETEGFSRRMGFEPGSHGRAERVDDVPSDSWWSESPNIDIRHKHNLTQSRWSQDQFRDRRNCRGWTESDSIPGWGAARSVLQSLGIMAAENR